MPEWVADDYNRYVVQVGGVTYRPVRTFSTEYIVGFARPVIVFDDVPARVTLPDGRTEMALSSWRLPSLDSAVALGLLVPVDPLPLVDPFDPMYTEG